MSAENEKISVCIWTVYAEQQAAVSLSLSLSPSFFYSLSVSVTFCALFA